MLYVSRKLLAPALFLAVIVGFIGLHSSTAAAAAGINQEINFQGRLLTSQGAIVADGYYNIEFKIYEGGNGQVAGDTGGTTPGTLLWTEDYLNVNSQGVQVVNGFLSVQLGSICPFSGGTCEGNTNSPINWNNNTLWLSMNVAGTNTTCSTFTACSPDGEMLPMKRLSADPYALNSQLLGGLASTQFLQLAQGLQTDASTNTNTIYINKTGTGNLIDLQSAGNDAFIVANNGDITFGSASAHTISIEASAASTAGVSLTVDGGSAGSGGTAAAGGNLNLNGGSAAGTGNANGGNVLISGGSGTGTGVPGLVILTTPTFSTTTNDPNCYANGALVAATCTIAQSTVDNSSTVLVGFSATGQTAFLPAPTNTTPGRIFYVSAAPGSQDFTLSVNSGGPGNEVAMRQDTSATMVWNGSAWAAAGASSSTDLQAAYDNTLQSPGGAELVVSHTSNTDGLNIRDSRIARNRRSSDSTPSPRRER